MIMLEHGVDFSTSETRAHIYIYNIVFLERTVEEVCLLGLRTNWMLSLCMCCSTVILMRDTMREARAFLNVPTAGTLSLVFAEFFFFSCDSTPMMDRFLCVYNK